MQEILVIGSGITGLTAALDLACLGHPARVVEKKETPGGHAANYTCKATDRCQQCGACLVDQALQKALQEPLITLSLSTEVIGVAPDPQGVMVTLRSPGGEESTVFPAVLVCTGFTPFNPREKPHLGFGRIPNIITGYELESMLRKKGRLLRPTDQKPPLKVAFVQCVGSRDASLGHLFCSRVCCAYALRTALYLKSAQAQTEITFFYMDVQTFGKDFHRIWSRIEEQLRLVREMPGEYYPLAGDRVGVVVPYEQGQEEEVFDLVVLSVGMMPSAEYGRWAREWGLEQDENGFLRPGTLPGVYVAGSATGPMGIEECVTHAHGAVQELLQYLGKKS